MPNKYFVPDGYKRRKYKKDFVKKVICRIDFDTPLGIIKSGPPPEIYELVKSRFPIVETKNLIGKELFVGPGPIREKQTHSKEWFYFGKEREKLLKIAPEYIVIEYTKYEYFEKLKEDFLSVIDALFKAFPKTRIKRMGLRYIDSIELPGNPFEWNNYFSNKLICNIDIASDKSTLSRVFNIVEFNYGDAFLKFQYGLYNNDYPAQIKKKEFILDYDMFTSEIIEKDDLGLKLDEFHIKLGSCFEEIITDDLRAIMEPIDE